MLLLVRLAGAGASSNYRCAVSGSIVVIGNHGAIGESDCFDTTQIVVSVCGGVGWHFLLSLVLRWKTTLMIRIVPEATIVDCAMLSLWSSWELLRLR